ncbi:MAG: hypothetical protein KME40_29595 [Komarekiella atlantica HA4396-MV6]|jgi:hypothetical protein|nr:hypothetical protein [Komarekiella atlantica HA4396-MV6]
MTLVIWRSLPKLDDESEESALDILHTSISRISQPTDVVQFPMSKHCAVDVECSDKSERCLRWSLSQVEVRATPTLLDQECDQDCLPALGY